MMRQTFEVEVISNVEGFFLGFFLSTVSMVCFRPLRCGTTQREMS